ncbi:unnamed protein product [Polarella glacialis]|uniref:Transmembrane protein n=1 Tax=Polarella glacialis TaxID=89957 RepID=A0A813JLR2_POLGL|nr:unnamed protein product [Polarella glacialis]CAE8681789.1 unnamed protein product [Polarella glacialis]
MVGRLQNKIKLRLYHFFPFYVQSILHHTARVSPELVCCLFVVLLLFACLFVVVFVCLFVVVAVVVVAVVLLSVVVVVVSAGVVAVFVNVWASAFMFACLFPFDGLQLLFHDPFMSDIG